MSRKIVLFWGFLGVFVLVLWLGSCTTAEPAPPGLVEEPETELPKDPEAPRADDPELEEDPAEDAVEYPVEDEEIPDEDIYIKTEDFVISTEMYETTFNEVEQFIAELNEIIADRDFQQWKSHLTEDYLHVHSDPAVLRERSESPVLRRNNIELRDIEDYFTWVVVPSRANARLDDLDFIGTDQVEAIMRVRDQGVILYQLKRVNDRWKIDVF